MIEGIINKLVDKLFGSEKVSVQEKDLVVFGLVQGAYTLVEMLGIIIIGAVLNLFLESLIILAAFVAIRIYAGGYHANTPFVCALKTWFMFLGGFMVLKCFELNIWFQSGTMCMSGMLIYLIAPVQHRNRILDKDEFKEYRIKALRNWFVEVVLFVVAWKVAWQLRFTECLTIANWMAMVLMVLGESIKKEKQERK